ncbi:hypothetical protein YC2023_076419 [Brassica napus]
MAKIDEYHGSEEPSRVEEAGTGDSISASINTTTSTSIDTATSELINTNSYFLDLEKLLEDMDQNLKKKLDDDCWTIKPPPSFLRSLNAKRSSQKN